MKKNILNFSFPTVIGVILLLAGIAAGVFLVKKQQFFGIKAGPQITPKNVTITNISSDRFTISWITEIPTTGFVKYADTEKINNTASDYRDQLTGDTKQYDTHYVNIENLKPGRKYYFNVGSGGTNNLYDNNGKLYEVTTGPVLGTQPPTDIIYGQVVTADKKPAEGTIVYLSIANSSAVSALVGKDGMWAKPLQTTRTNDLSNYITYDGASTVLTVNATLGLEKTLNSQVLLTTKNDTPVPTITLGNNEDYRTDAQNPEPENIQPSQETPQNFPQEPVAQPPQPEQNLVDASPDSGFGDLTNNSASSSASTSASLKFTNPGQDGESLNTPKPLFMGTGPKQKILTVKVESPQTYTGSVTVDDQGIWQYTPPEDLTPGNHKITVNYVDENGQPQEIVRNFVVLAAGESDDPAFESSPSGSSPSPSIAPIVTMPSTSAGVPQTGFVGPTFIVFIGGIVFLIIGFWLQLANRKSTR